MVALPIPVIFALIILFLLVGSLRKGGLGFEVTLLLSLCAWQSLAISLVHYYGLTVLRPALPVMACALPPLAWLAFRTALIAPVPTAKMLPHVLTPTLAAIILVAAPPLLDLYVPLTFVGYGLAILWALRPAEALPRARLDAGPWPARIWQTLAAALLLSALGDGIIALAFAFGKPEIHGLVVSFVSSLSLFMVGFLALTRDGRAPVENETVADPVPTEFTASPDEQALVARLEDLLLADRLFLEPDLTLARLARRLQVPAKQLSAAVNKQTGENISRHVNGFRIRHACALLEKDRPVTEAIYASGFNTKSNFNREFQRVTGASPSAWRAQQVKAKEVKS